MVIAVHTFPAPPHATSSRNQSSSNRSAEITMNGMNGHSSRRNSNSPTPLPDSMVGDSRTGLSDEVKEIDMGDEYEEDFDEDDMDLEEDEEKHVVHSMYSFFFVKITC